MRRDEDAVELGARRGSYPIAGITGALLQTGRRFVVLFCLVALGYLVVSTSVEGLSRGLVALAVIVVVIGLRVAWGRLSLRLGVRVCHLHTGGVVVTGLFGQTKHVVPWDRVAVLKHMSNMSPLLTFHRFELVRHDGGTVAILVLQRKPELASALKRASHLAGMREA
ncbi:hypothetical protein ACFV06_04140 [Streptomyces sp. NPDC059618]|uniref:hypothetical protein n=1 Tax=Streptomyces sp. NPDC059618 TaxID=3346887 RepID=UPI0036B7DA3A